MSAVVVFVACRDRDEGERIANHLVSERLAACVNVIPRVHSVYRWQGAVQHEHETLLLIKTTDECLSDLTRRVGGLHSYEVPEILALPVAGGGAPYLDWLNEQVK